jgi:hypothetical protein
MRCASVPGRNEKCPGNLLCCQAANFTQRERYLSFRRQSGMAAGKDETEAVVLDFLILERRLVDARLEVEREPLLKNFNLAPSTHRTLECSRFRFLSNRHRRLQTGNRFMQSEC